MRKIEAGSSSSTPRTFLIGPTTYANAWSNAGLRGGRCHANRANTKRFQLQTFRLQSLTLPVKNRNSLPMSTSLSSLSPQQLRRAAALKEKIQSLEKKIHQLLGSSTKPVAQAVPKKKRRMSAAGRAKISAAAKARWAKIKGEKLSVKPARKARRKMSAAGRARISAAAKARWAKIRAKKK